MKKNKNIVRKSNKFIFKYFIKPIILTYGEKALIYSINSCFYIFFEFI